MSKNNLERNVSFFNCWAYSYDTRLFQFWMKGFHQPVFQEIDFGRKGKVIDLSCGTGELLKSLQGKDVERNLQLGGMDISEEMLNKAQAKLPQLTFSRGDVHTLHFPSHHFDYVLSTEAFHHYYDQPKALQEMVRIAAKGGRVIIVDVNFFLASIHFLFRKLEPGCRKINSRKEMKTLFASAGLRNIRQKRTFLFAVLTVGEKV